MNWQIYLEIIRYTKVPFQTPISYSRYFSVLGKQTYQNFISVVTNSTNPAAWLSLNDTPWFVNKIELIVLKFMWF